MTDDNADLSELTELPLYASFAVRVRAWLIDVALMAGVLALVIIAGELMRDVPGSGLVLVALFFGIPVFYEPFFVSRYGATIGHRRANLCVIAEETQRRPGFWRAFLRFVIKGALGLVSFVAMAFTTRHQAIHDHVTRTTVQLRDPLVAQPGDFLLARVSDPAYTLPSRTRRVVVSLLYLTALFLITGIASSFLVSMECLEVDRCTSGEDAVVAVLGIGWIGLSLLCIIAGGRGQLPGARRRRAEEIDGVLTA
jgi:uncharacterized RDD family membrane protein YckC